VLQQRAPERERREADEWAHFEFKKSFENPICSELNWLQTLAPMLQKFEKKIMG
jgi:hypothetical protein